MRAIKRNAIYSKLRAHGLHRQHVTGRSLVLVTIFAVITGALHAHRSCALLIPQRQRQSVRSALTLRSAGAVSNSALRGSSPQISSFFDRFLWRWFRLKEGHGKALFSPVVADGGDQAQSLKRLGNLMKHEWPLLLVAVIFLLLAAGLRVLIPQAVASTLMLALAQGGGAQNQHAFLSAAQRLGCLALGYGAASGLRGLFMSVAGNRLVMRLRQHTFARMLQQGIAFFDEREVGELTSRLHSDCESVSSGLVHNLNIFLRSAVQLLFGVCYLTSTSWQLSSMLLVVWAMLFYIYFTYGRFTRRAAEERQGHLAQTNTLATETLHNVRTVRALGVEKLMIKKYAESSDNLLFIDHRLAAAYGFYATFYFGLTQGIQAVALAAGGALIAKGMLNAEALTASLLYVDMVVNASLAVGSEYRQLQRCIGASKRVFEYAEMPLASSVASCGRCLPDLGGGVRFSKVSFAYPARPDDPVLQGLDLDILPGKTTALVGPSGSGKSTVAALLQRWYDPDRGDVLVDGVPIQELDPSWMRSLLGVVTQDPGLFSATVWENIALGLDSSREESSVAKVMKLVHEAAEAAQAHEFIQDMPNGYATMVGSTRLSGGQRQRLALARALAREPQILILDEATSALDRETERRVHASISAYLHRRGGTCVVIAHRLSTVRNADRIIVLDQGRLVEQGTHKELLQMGGYYTRLVQGDDVAEEQLIAT